MAFGLRFGKAAVAAGWLVALLILLQASPAVEAATYPLSSSASFTASWTGVVANERLGSGNSSGLGVQFVNADNGVYSNDLLIIAPGADPFGRNAAGSIYLIKNIDSKGGSYFLDSDVNFDVRFDGGTAGDQLGYTYDLGQGVQLVNADNGAYANDLLIVAVSASTHGLSGNGAVYLIKNIDSLSGAYVLDTDANFDVRLAGGAASDNLGATGNGSGGTGVQLVNADNGAYANDLLIAAYNADTQGLTNNGAVYLIKNTDSLSGSYLLDSDANFDVRWDGSFDSGNFPSTNGTGDPVQLFNSDNGAYSNDLVMAEYKADTQGLSNNGAIYIVKDIDSLSGNYLLDSDANFDARFDGAANMDYLGGYFMASPGKSFQIVNSDNDTYADDLLITAQEADAMGINDNGAVYLIKDVGGKSGNYLLDADVNYDVRWAGGAASDTIGLGATDVEGVQFVNVDNGAYSNDLLISAYQADTHGMNGNGAVYLVKDIDSLSGSYLLDDDANFDVRWSGARASDNLGKCETSSQAVQLVNVDNGAYSNDLLLTALDANAWGELMQAGAVYLIKNIDSLSGEFVLTGDANFDASFHGASASDQLGSSINSGQAVQLVDVDNDAYSNDLLITASYADTQGLADNGAVYLIKNIDSLSAAYILDNDANFDAMWAGGAASDNLGATGNGSGGRGVQLVNVDNGSYSNDLLVTAYLGDTQGLGNNGAVYLIKDIGSLSGSYLLDSDVNFGARFDGAAANDQISNTIISGSGVQLVNADDNSHANDLLITAPNADAFGLSNSGAVYLFMDLMDVNAPDVNVWKIDGNPADVGLPSFSYASDGNLTIDFNVSDRDNDRLSVDINYSTVGALGNGTSVVRDMNLDSGVCPSLDWDDNVSMCSWDLNIVGWGDGNYFVIISVTGLASFDYNISSESFLVDNNGPTTVDNDFNSTWQNTDANVQFSCSDGSGVGCKNFYYSLVDVNYTVAWGDANIGIVLDWDGNHEIFYWSDDTADQNEEAKLLFVEIDKTAPSTVDNDFNSTWQNTDANVQFSCSDVNAGCKNFYYSLDDVNHQEKWGLDLNIGIVLDWDGNHEIFYWSDNNTTGVGDNNEAAKLLFVEIDKSAPVSVDDHNNVWQNTDANVQISCSDANGGCRKLFYSWGDVNYEATWGLDLNVGISITEDGNHTVYYWSDNNTTGVGDNNEAAHLIWVALDKTKPTTIHSWPTSDWSSSDVNVNFLCSDVNGGCKNFYYSLDDANSTVVWGPDLNIGINLATDGNHEIFFWSDDNTTGVGDNNEAAQLLYVAVDTSDPSTPSISSGTGTTRASYVLRYSTTDATSGIKKYWVKQDSGNWIDNATNTTYTFDIGSGTPLPATRTYCVKVTDNSDNNSGEACRTVMFESASGGNIVRQPSPVPGDVEKGLGQACSSYSECESGKCVDGKCGECFSDAECSDDRHCSQGLCLLVTGECGYAENHAWVAWGCCSNADCAEGYYCDAAAHTCIAAEKPRLVVSVAPAEVIENEEFTVTVLDGGGKPVPGAIVAAAGQQMEADASGVVALVLPFGVYRLLVSKEGFVGDEREIEVKKEMLLEIPLQARQGQLVEIKALDAARNPISGVEVAILFSNGETQVLKTNEEGLAYLQSMLPGEIEVTALAAGYAVQSATVSIMADSDSSLLSLLVVGIFVVFGALWLLARKGVLPVKR